MKLKALKPRLSAPPPHIRSAADPTGHANPLRHLYNTAQWKRTRWRILSRDLFTCQMCGKIEPDTSKLVADHIEPHRGDPAKFWCDDAGIRTLCADPCHNKVKQAEEVKGYSGAVDADGFPIDARHPFNRRQN